MNYDTRMVMADSSITEKEITRDSERNQILELDNRGRVTIPSALRSRYGIDPEDDKEYWIELSIHSIEVREPDGGDE